MKLMMFLRAKARARDYCRRLRRHLRNLPLYERGSGAKGDVQIWLEPHVVNQLRRLRGPGESFSDVILAAQD
jgi:hypothetical protein